MENKEIMNNEIEVNEMTEIEDLPIVEESSGYAALAAFGGACCLAGVGIVIGVQKLIQKHKDRKAARAACDEEGVERVKVDRTAIARIRKSKKKASEEEEVEE